VAVCDEVGVDLRHRRERAESLKAAFAAPDPGVFLPGTIASGGAGFEASARPVDYVSRNATEDRTDLGCR
jgi:hypothetical protein